MKYNNFKWHKASVDPKPGKLLLIQHQSYVYPDFRFAIFSFKGDNEYYQVFPDEPSKSDGRTVAILKISILATFQATG